MAMTHSVKLVVIREKLALLIREICDFCQLFLVYLSIFPSKMHFYKP